MIDVVTEEEYKAFIELINKFEQVIVGEVNNSIKENSTGVAIRHIENIQQLKTSIHTVRRYLSSDLICKIKGYDKFPRFK